MSESGKLVERISFGNLAMDRHMSKKNRNDIRDLLFEALKLIEDEQDELREKIEKAIEKIGPENS